MALFYCKPFRIYQCVLHHFKNQIFQILIKVFLVQELSSLVNSDFLRQNLDAKLHFKNNTNISKSTSRHYVLTRSKNRNFFIFLNHFYKKLFFYVRLLLGGSCDFMESVRNEYLLRFVSIKIHKFSVGIFMLPNQDSTNNWKYFQIRKKLNKFIFLLVLL